MSDPMAADAPCTGDGKASILSDALDPVISEDAVGHAYRAKATLLNTAVQQIGMGRYQVMLFFVIGFGWASDNLWPVVTSLILPPVASEFNVQRKPLLVLAQNIGLLVGALFWGFGCDVFGRRWAFSLTLGITAVFGLVAAGSPTFAAVGVFAALWSFGVGGNLPVDSAIFLEFLPGTHQYLLTVLSTYWALAEVFANLIAWPLIGNMTCAPTAECTKGQNMGWRYFVIVMGGVWMIFFVVRFLFPILESPKYLMGKGRDAESVAVVHRLASINRRSSTLSLEQLSEIAPDEKRAADEHTFRARVSRATEDFHLDHIAALFATRQMAWSTSLIVTIWALVGLGFPLYNAFIPVFQQESFHSAPDTVYYTYRNLLIVAVMGVPACILGAVMVETPKVGRKGTLCISTLLTGVFLFCSTTASDSSALLGWQCAYRFSSSTMYAVLYTYTPEIFPTKDRGSGNALAACANRIFGIVAPIIAMYADLETKAPVYVNARIAPKVLVVTLFSPERAAWLTELPLKNCTRIAGLSPLFPDLCCDGNGSVCLVTTGEGEINAAASMAALLYAPVVDLRKSYVLVNGIAGVSPDAGTVGSVGFARFAVQVGLQYGLDGRSLPHGWDASFWNYGTSQPDTYPTLFYGSEVFEMNAHLRDRVFNLVKNERLADSHVTRAHRKAYPEAPARDPPRVFKGDVTTSDLYFTGHYFGEMAANLTALMTNNTGIYALTAQEDNAVLAALVRAHKAGVADYGRAILYRAASDFDRAPPRDSDYTHFERTTNNTEIGVPALKNLFRIGGPIVASIVHNWTDWEDGMRPQDSRAYGDVLGTLQ
ncbi:hypothetical protein MSPP1_003522 [Malassezia sp. CBS 17886]|nr:hypothetical protein MSPP1_003522 [Malassezia sp. CBS 17886]